MPEGCPDSRWRRLRDEWGIVGGLCRRRGSDPERARAIVSQHGSHVAMHVLHSKRDAEQFLGRLRTGCLDDPSRSPPRPELARRRASSPADETRHLHGACVHPAGQREPLDGVPEGDVDGRVAERE
jgi:hypothetical protein